MIVVTHATAPAMMFNDLMADLKRFGLTVQVYGMGEEWHGFRDKINTAYRAACEHPDETILFLDGFDTRVIAPVIDFVFDNAFFSTEKRCWPDAHLADQYPVCNSPWRFLNSGGYIAPASWIKKLIDTHPIPDELPSGQRYWTARFLEGNNRLRLDTDCWTFQSTAFAHRQQWADYGGKTFNLTTMTTPAILHFNGRAKEWMPDGKTGLQAESERYADRTENHAERVKIFTELVNETYWLKAHRDFAEKGFGFGERCFHWLWHLLVGEMPKEFKALEIGVYKGQVLSLIQLLADEWDKSARVFGVTPLSSTSGPSGEFRPFPESNYRADIEKIHAQFGVPMCEIIHGDSTQPEIVAQARQRGQFDIVYVDGCHEHESAKSDLIHYSRMVKPGGYLVVDDAAVRLNHPDGFFRGIKSVDEALERTIEQDIDWQHVLAVMHNRVFRRLR